MHGRASDKGSDRASDKGSDRNSRAADMRAVPEAVAGKLTGVSSRGSSWCSIVWHRGVCRGSDTGRDSGRRSARGVRNTGSDRADG